MIYEPQPPQIVSRPVLLWGGRSKARILAEMLQESRSGITTLIFDNTLDELPFDTTALFTNDIAVLKARLPGLTHYIVCIGGEHGYARFKTAQRLEKLGLKSIMLIHDKSYIDPTAVIGEGCQVMPCATVHKFTTIGDHTILNTGATIDHECIIGNGVHIMGSAAIAGKVEVGDYATIGTNATVLPFIKIGEGSFVGAGAVVTRDVDPYTVVAGIPAKKLRKNELKFFDGILNEL